jgi:2-oxoglutarate dehydrogenase E1 component
MSSARILSTSLGSVLTGENVAFLEHVYARFKEDPGQVDPSWHLALSLLDGAPANGGTPTATDVRNVLRARGHMVAALDPVAALRCATTPSERAGTLHPLAADEAFASLAATYCGFLGLETEHMDRDDLRKWAYRAFESHEPASDGELAAFVRSTLEAAEFERLMHTKFPTKKRFGIEGGETLIPLVKRVLQRLSAHGVERAVIGTMHRGRLNLLTNALGRPLEITLAEFSGKHPFDNGTAADVPYHLGWRDALDMGGGRRLDIDLLPNPSHLEAVNPVVLGKARGLQDADGRPTAAVILHTDAAVIAQGSVAEIIQLAGLAGYTTGGTIHIVVNNQIGFTTEPEEARTSRYCTGAWKATDSLIMHVNAENPEAIIKAADIGVAYRCAHGRDSVIDFVCYRRNGHNEIDEPRFTQPLLYRKIDAHPPIAGTLAGDLSRRGIVSRETVEAWKSSYENRFLETYDRVKQGARAPRSAPAARPDPVGQAGPTGVDVEKIAAILRDLAEAPADFPIDHRLQRILRGRGELAQTGINWPTAEALAVATLNNEGVAVRLTGQDVVRGAFSHRHFEISNRDTGERVRQIGRAGENRSLFDVRNSPLSEYAALGFEYGYSLARSDCLTIWEAQFGDFANGAQIIIDQFIASAKEKWNLDSGLIVLLPHGLDGQGPEHSSARIERFLQLSEPATLDVAVPSTPANYFHLIREQALRPQKRPLALMGAKVLLRHPSAISPIGDFGTGTRFLKIIAGGTAAPEKAAGIVFCTGKIYYELERRLQAAEAGIRVVRIERIAPFPEEEIVAQLRLSPDAVPVFLQEEPQNMGALHYLRPRIEQALRKAGCARTSLRTVSRPASGSPAGSFHVSHEEDQSSLIDEALAAAGRAPAP